MIQPLAGEHQGRFREVPVTIDVHPDREVGLVDPNIYGHFLESNFFGNIEGGVFDEGSPLALSGPGPSEGLRADVIEACRALGVPVVRWPGGNFASAYHWEDGVGPRDERPCRLDLTWLGPESNRFGTDEFLAWCQAIDAEPYLTHSCRSVEEAVRWVEYTNYAGRTAYTAARAANGHPEPWRVRYWGIGNEVWGPWQMGHRAADAYAADAREHALFMRKVDPALQLIAVGPRTPSDEQWAQHLLERAGNLVDYLSLHLYGASLHLGGVDDYEAVVTQPRYFEEQISATADLLSTTTLRAGVERPLSIALDEWNLRHLEPADWPEPQPGARGGTAPRRLTDADGHAGRLRVNRYSPRTLADALFYGGVLNVLHRLSGASIAVRMANTVNLVNANALLEVRPEGLVRSATYQVWDLYQRHLGRRVVEATVAGRPKTVAVRQGAGGPSGELRTKPAELPPLDVVATTAGDGVIQLAVINRHRSESVAARLVRDGGAANLPPAVRVWELGTGTEDVWASNNLDTPERVAVADRGVRKLTDGCYEFAPHSITVLEWAQ